MRQLLHLHTYLRSPHLINRAHSHVLLLDRLSHIEHTLRGQEQALLPSDGVGKQPRNMRRIRSTTKPIENSPFDRLIHVMNTKLTQAVNPS